MSDINTDHYPDMAEDELYERRDELLEQRDANVAYPRPSRLIRMELISLADALDACKRPEHR